MFETAEGGSTEREEACQSQPNGHSGPDDGDGGDDDGDGGDDDGDDGDDGDFDYEDGDGGSTERDVNPSLMATLVLPSLVLCIQRKHCKHIFCTILHHLRRIMHNVPKTPPLSCKSVNELKHSQRQYINLKTLLLKTLPVVSKQKLLL